MLRNQICIVFVTKDVEPHIEKPESSTEVWLCIQLSFGLFIDEHRCAIILCSKSHVVAVSLELFSAVKPPWHCDLMLSWCTNSETGDKWIKWKSFYWFLPLSLGANFSRLWGLTLHSSAKLTCMKHRLALADESFSLYSLELVFPSKNTIHEIFHLLKFRDY